ncbi:MAG: cytochrome c6 PetJ [Microcoleaceae cyanobacterium]
MKKLLSIILLGLTIFVFALQTPAMAAGDAVNGAKIFSANCASCHIGGKNVIMAEKTLAKSALSQYLAGYDADPEKAITSQITMGKGAMPAFAGRLSPEQIADVATYVAEKSASGW